MKQLQKVPHRRRFGQRIAQPALQAGVVGQQSGVLGAGSHDGLQQHNGLDQLALAKPALAFAQLEVGGDQVGQAQGTEGAGNGQGPRARAAGLQQRLGVQPEGRLVQQWQPG